MTRTLGFDEETSRRIEAMYRSPDAIRRRSLVLSLLEPRSGERVLDVGCGPGFLASELAAAVGPHGRVDAIDSSPVMLGLAKARCEALPWVAVREGDAARPGFDDAAFDAIASVQVHEYVRDVEGSLREAARVLRPGGRLLLVATDWDSIVWAADDAARMARVLSAFDEHLAHPDLPRRLEPLLRDAGFEPRRCEVLVQMNRVYDPNTFSAGLLELIRRFVPGRRGVDRDEADAWADDLRGRGARGAYFFSLNQYAFLAVKL
ncbi:MAG: methyltransferase type 11 [Proteobacteria bacterium]|nr:MAG: methyltransferase type 11 [Pseudomonadota bacterium]